MGTWLQGLNALGGGGVCCGLFLAICMMPTLGLFPGKHKMRFFVTVMFKHPFPSQEDP